MRIDWSVPQHCLNCNRKMRGKRAEKLPDTVVYSGKGICKNCDRLRYLNENPEAQELKRQRRMDSFYSKYSMTRDDYTALLQAQEFRCAVCSVHQDDVNKPLYVDHDHSCCPSAKSCGKCVRGLLCVNCNFALGHLKDDIETVKKLLSYLIKYN